MNNFFQFLLWQAPPAPQAPASNPYMTLIFMGGMLGVVYFFMIRPQSQIRKKQKDFNSSLKKGDRVVTIGGLHGTIIELNEGNLTLLVDKEKNVRLTFQKEAISYEMTNSAYGASKSE